MLKGDRVSVNQTTSALQVNPVIAGGWRESEEDLHEATPALPCSTMPVCASTEDGMAARWSAVQEPYSSLFPLATGGGVIH